MKMNGMAELELLKLMFIEEPVRTEEIDAFLPQLLATSTPIALGERLYSRWDFKAILASGAVDIIQPDPSHAGGISETRRNSAGYVTIPTGPGLGIDVNEDYVSERALEGHRWRNPVWRHADGSVAEW
jgi:L-alanine-DL-glutamate epimerase-like enolase superfamily enzyme